MGFLTINNKCYPIYEGLNVVGRDIKATVLLKDVVRHTIYLYNQEEKHCCFIEIQQTARDYYCSG